MVMLCFITASYLITGILLHFIPSNHSFTYSIIYYYQYRLMDILFYWLLCNTRIIWFQVWPLEALSSWFSRPFDVSHPFLALLCFLAPKMFQNRLLWPLSQFFLHSALVPLTEELQSPRSGHKICSLLLECHCFQAFPEDRARKYIYVQ